MMTVFYTQSYAQKTLCNGSLYLDGTDDFGRISSSFFDTIPNQSTFTIEFYIKLGNNPTRYPAVWSQYGNGTYMGIYPCSGVRMVYKNTNTYGTDSAGIRQGTWEHYAITGDGPTAKLKIYRNGLLIGTTNQGTPDWNYVDNSARIGAAFDLVDPNKSWFLNAHIDDFRVSRTIRYTQDFTPPQNLESDADTKVLYTFNAVSADSIVLDISGNNNHLKLEGDATIVEDAPYSGGDGLVFKQSGNIFPDINAPDKFWVYSKDGNASFQWQVNIGSGFNNISDTLPDFTGVNADTLHINACKIVFSNYAFRCIVKSGICSDTTSALTMTVCGKIIQVPTSVEALGKDTIRFVVGHTDTLAQYQWQKKIGSSFVSIADSGIYSGTKTSTITILNKDLGGITHTYRCSIKSGICLDTIVPVNIFICGALVSSPENVNAAKGATASFTANHTDPLAEYQWQINNGTGFKNIKDTLQYSGSTTKSLKVANLSFTNNFNEFRCIIKSASCFDTTQKALLKVCGSILSQNITQNVKIGDNAQFAIIHNDPSTIFAWQINIGTGWNAINDDNRVSGSKTNIIKINAVTWSDNGYTFRCIANSSICSDTSLPARLSVCGSIIKQPKSTFAPFGKTSQLSVGNSDPQAFYQWQSDLGQGFQKISDLGQYSGTNDSVLSINNITISNNNQSFRCLVKSNDCTDTSSIATLTVCGSIENDPFDISVNAGEDAFFAVKHNDPMANYRWQTDFGVGFLNITNAGQYSGANKDTLLIRYVSNTNNNQKFRCITSSNNCIDTSQSVTLFIKSVSGIVNSVSEDAITVYPNPAHDKIFFILPNSGQKTEFYITDILGNSVLKGIISESSTINIDHLQSSMYFIHIDNQKPIKLMKH